VAGNLGPLYEEKKVIDSPYYLKKFTPHNGGFHLSKFCIISQEQSSADYGEGDPSMGHSRTQFCFPLLFCWIGVLCGIYKGSYNVSNISYLNSPHFTTLLHSHSPDSWNSFNRYHFAFTYMYTHYLHHNPPPPRTCSTLLFSNFVEEKT
jgi:hypothetical protein